MQQNCGSCFGTGRVTCPQCYGRRQTSRMTLNGDVDITPCGVCGGTGKVKCNFCHGRGTIEVAGYKPEVNRTSRKANSIEGKWMGNDGGWYEFTKNNGNYTVVCGNGTAILGRGTAIVNNTKVIASINFPILGTINLEFSLKGNELICFLETMGMRIPVALYPV